MDFASQSFWIQIQITEHKYLIHKALSEQV